jgi:regulator of protease activity HflC (stomatin/prohibitin superfamily)
VNSTVLYRLDPARATTVYRILGNSYSTQIVRPTARECIRTTFTEYPIVQASTTAWGALQTDVAKCMSARVEPQGIDLLEFQLREVTLNPQLQAAVTQKISSQQGVEQEHFELQTAEQAADITRIQALATADSQQILACGGHAAEVTQNAHLVETVVPNPVTACSQAQLTPQYLQFTYIQALKQLVNSPNNSTVILPFDQNLTPLLNVGNSSSNATVTSPSGSPSASATTPTTSPNATTLGLP